MKNVMFSATMALLMGAALAVPEQRIWDDRPGGGSGSRSHNASMDVAIDPKASPDWQSSWYPLGNGRLGCMVDGKTDALTLQFNVDSLFSGDENISSAISDREADRNYARMGEYQNFGFLTLAFKDQPTDDVTDYRRELDLATATYTDSFKKGGVQFRRTVFASAPDQAIFVVIRSDRPFAVVPTLEGTHGEKPVQADSSVTMNATLRNGLAFAARVDRLASDDPTCVAFALRAETGTDAIAAPTFTSWRAAHDRHMADYKSLYDRFELDLGEGDQTVPTRERVARVRAGARDVPLTALQFNFGRYLLISCSRKGTLPANLQGLWNNSNAPAWHCDYHTNINLQMNYWGADAANLSDCFEALSDWMLATMPVAEKGTRAAFPEAKGFAYRTSVNAVGGGGWRWNFAGAPWLAAQCYDHWLFTRDGAYLKDVCWPLLKGSAEFILSTQLKERADGTIVMKDGWSPEHGPRVDGVAHDQQICRELFRAILAAAKTLGIDDEFVREVARVEPKLLKDKIGSWGQLQEWEADWDKKGDDHRHSSHLYAVYPGSTITKATPELYEAAKVALNGRTLSGDSRRSWSWPWRAALWARLGEAEKADAMLEGLLRYNTFENLFATHPPFQIDGNLGMVAAVCEILLERQIPSAWQHGRVKGLRTRDGKTIEFAW